MKKLRKMILVIIIIGGSVFALGGGEKFLNAIINIDKDKEPHAKYENYYNICKSYIDTDKTLDCYLEYDIRLEETLDEWIKRHDFYYRPNGMSISESISYLGAITVGLLLVFLPIVYWNEEKKGS
jgi:hypothetical protein